MLRTTCEWYAHVAHRFRTVDRSKSISIVWTGDADRVFRRMLGGRVDHSATGLAVLDVQRANMQRLEEDLASCDEDVFDFIREWESRPSLKRDLELFRVAYAMRADASVSLCSIVDRLAEAGRAPSHDMLEEIWRALDQEPIRLPVTDGGA